ncbi:related to dynein light-intermediate chain [Cephalotrichum gorgonifer]|uniref:Related to dynein light-intermediate chain n=1 Tax=Cephalotrichum gorgonifer TaxID=2041049 RepID=A0AAE8MW76_9PEZI|nr:related to dynein light-intermediate chain [Cephalotrichum gorgonifer]
MTVGANRISTYTSTSTGTDGRNAEQKNLWTTMLGSAASGKRLPEKNILVLGGSPETQREFLDSLSTGDQRRTIDRQRVPPVANNFALGYTYYDVLDADQEDTLARISLYLLSTPSPSFSSLIKPLLTPETIPNTLIVVLLDWSQPHAWLRQLQEWILMLRDILQSLDSGCMDAMEEVMVSWRDRGRTGSSLNIDGTGAVPGEGNTALPLGPSEWADGLGLPLCVVCQNADKMEILEKTQGWKEADFDQILQYLRTILLRHGASLIYTTQHLPSQLQSLIHASLGISSLIKRDPLNPNVIDRDKILVPPNWDSWGKIRVIREGFDVEVVSSGWQEDIQQDWPLAAAAPHHDQEDGENGVAPAAAGAVGHYEEWVPHASVGLQITEREGDTSAVEVTSEDAQAFLAEQAKVLEAMRLKAAEADKERVDPPRSMGRKGDELDLGVGRGGGSIVSDHIGPVQFNMGGIQVDADDMLQRIKDRQEYATPDPTTPPPPADGPPNAADSAGLEAFFMNLMNRKPGASAAGSPAR